MNLYILIIFVAEALIFIFVINALIKWNKAAVHYNAELVNSRPKLEKALDDFADGVHKMLASVEKFSADARLRTTSKNLILFAVNILLTILMFKMKGKAKKLPSFLRLLMSIKNFIFKKLCYI